MLVGVAAAAVWGAINLGTSNAGVFLVDAGHTGSVGASSWALGSIAGLITLSLGRFVIFGLP
jgi:hypothetical protein